MKAFVIAVVLLTCGAAPWLATRAGAQEKLPDTCLTLNWNGFEMNPDSIYVDTCLTTHRHPVFWDKGPYFVVFDSNVIRLGYGAPDSDLEVGWQAIDTAFPVLRNIFEAMANNLGLFKLKKLDPTDTSDVRSQVFHLIFQNYVPNDSVTSYLSQSPSLTFQLIWYPALTEVVPQNSNSFNEIRVFPDPAHAQLNVVLNGTEPGTRMELIDMMGRIVETHVKEGTGVAVLSLRDLPSGFYIVRVGAVQQFFIKN